jgi:hypothetical protein
MLRRIRSRNTRRGLRAVSVVALILSLPILEAGLAYSAPDVTPTFIAGNPSCQDVDASWTELKIDEPGSGTQSASDGTLSVTITVHPDATFDWTSNIGVDAVLVKGGPNANLYRYDPPAEVTSDDGLHAPDNPNSGTYYGLSHISFCYDTEAQPSESPSASGSPSASSSPSVSVSPSVSTSPSSSPTVSESPTVSTSPTVSATVTVSSSASSSTSVLPTLIRRSPTKVQGVTLGRTGAGRHSGLLALALALMGVGVLLLVVSAWEPKRARA